LRLLRALRDDVAKIDAQAPPLDQQGQQIVLFADVSGFTPLKLRQGKPR
jgi:hypothetical protein